MTNILKEVAYEMQQQRANAEDRASANKERALQDPVYAAAHTEVTKEMLALTRQIAEGANYTAAQTAYEKALAHRESVAKEKGIDESSFFPRYACEICQDTGYTAEGKTCGCLKARYYEKLNQSCGLPVQKLSSFRSLDFTFYPPDERDSAKQKATSLYRYAHAYPNVPCRNALLYGKSGTGKTFLAGCVANELVERGFTLLFLTSFSLNQMFLRYIKEQNSDILDRLCQADYLVIDDLGSEAILKNVTCEFLQTVLSARLQENKGFLITSNLKGEQLAESYGQKLFSRIASNDTLILHFVGKDLRVRRK